MLAKSSTRPPPRTGMLILLSSYSSILKNSTLKETIRDVILEINFIVFYVPDAVSAELNDPESCPLGKLSWGIITGSCVLEVFRSNEITLKSVDM